MAGLPADFEIPELEDLPDWSDKDMDLVISMFLDEEPPVPALVAGGAEGAGAVDAGAQIRSAEKKEDAAEPEKARPRSVQLARYRFKRSRRPVCVRRSRQRPTAKNPPSI
jgi:hypothetical protein